MPVFDENGVLVPPQAPTTKEKADMLAYLGLINNPDEGVALSHLRVPGSKTSLQRVEAVVLALVADGKVSAEMKQTVKGGKFNLYRLVGA